MKPENIISAAQARLNFCDPEYVALYKEINNQITEKSRTKTQIEVKSTVSSTVRDMVINDLLQLGYQADYYFIGMDRDSRNNIYSITIKW